MRQVFGISAFQITRYALVLCFFFTPLKSRPQDTSPNTTTTDPIARSVMEQALKALGGKSAWRSIHTASSHAVVTTARNKKSEDLYMLDDWSQSETHYIRGIKGRKEQPVERRTGKKWTINDGGKEKTIPDYDQATVLLNQLPGAAAEVILRRPEYVLKNLPATRCPALSDCVLIAFVGGTKAHPTVLIPIQLWVLSSSTHLPTSIQFCLHTPTPQFRPHWETITYDSYGQTGQVQYPLQTTVNISGGSKTVFAYSEPALNIEFDASLVQKAVQQ